MNGFALRLALKQRHEGTRKNGLLLLLGMPEKFCIYHDLLRGLSCPILTLIV